MKKKTKKGENSINLLFKNLVRTFKLYWHIDKKGLLLFTFAVTILALIPALNSYFWGQMLNIVVEYISGNSSRIDEIYVYFGLSALLSALNFFLWKTTNFLNKMSWFAWHEYMFVELPRKISSLDIEKFEDHKFKNLINKIEQGSGHRPANFAESLIWTIFQSIGVITSLIIISSFNLILLPIILISLTPGLIILVKQGKQTWGIWDAKGDISHMAGNNAWYLRNEDYVKEIRIFGIRDYILGIITKLFHEFQNEHRNVEKRTMFRMIGTGFLEIIINIGIQFWLLLRVINPGSGLGIGDFTFMNSTIERFTESVRNLLRNIAGLYAENLYMSDLYKLFDTESKIISKPNALKIDTKKVPSIEFRNVGFTYPGTTRKIFENLNITINPGEDIAFVGENGAGKTTFVKLLMRFYDVTEGEILINGVNIKDIDLDTYYKNIGVLFQQFNQYYYKVKENIAVGNIDKKMDFELVKKSAKSAGAYTFVQEYKNKFNQYLDRNLKGGMKPSGGQWQRIALARAFYRSANILILDEPTSAIDAKGEYEIFNEIKKLQEEKTTIIISHRFSTVRNADKIYVIEHGKIIESGSHDDLMKNKDGRYKYMFELQAEGYK